MSRYFLDTEFLEGTQKSWFGKTKPTIDLISIGIVAEDGREYYAVSKDFNLKEAWNRFDLERQNHPFPVKKYWLRDNVLKPIFIELVDKELKDYNSPYHKALYTLKEKKYMFSYKRLNELINKYGKTNKEIAEEIKKFVYYPTFKEPTSYVDTSNWSIENPQFYAYFADYDWVVFCWLFGRMIDLPKGFSWYCNDLKQTLDEKQAKLNILRSYNSTIPNWIEKIQEHPDYPKQVNEHNALADARWTFELYKFLKKL